MNAKNLKLEYNQYKDNTSGVHYITLLYYAI